MNNHCGVLTQGHSPLLARIKAQEWPKHPPEVALARDIALLTPGFTHAWWSRQIERSRDILSQHRRLIDPALIPQALENYNSITREDCLALTKLPGLKPFRVKVQLVEDVRNGMTWTQAAETYGVTTMTVGNLLRYPLLSDPTLPVWFRALIPGA